MEGTEVSLGIEELKRNLQHQLTLYKRLLELVREEKDLLIKVDSKALRELTCSKEALIDELYREEFRRQKWLKKTAETYQRNFKDLTLETIASIEGPAHYEDLMSLRATLQMFIKKVQKSNWENKRVAEAAIKEAHEMKKNILGIVSDDPKVYGPKGCVAKQQQYAGS